MELATAAASGDEKGVKRVTREIIEEALQHRTYLYDRAGEAHYDTISAFIKSLRGSDPDAAIYWLARMIEAGEDPLFIVRRMVILAAEDVGLADPQALVVATAVSAGGALRRHAGGVSTDGRVRHLPGVGAEEQLRPERLRPRRRRRT